MEPSGNFFFVLFVLFCFVFGRVKLRWCRSFPSTMNRRIGERVTEITRLSIFITSFFTYF